MTDGPKPSDLAPIAAASIVEEEDITESSQAHLIEPKALTSSGTRTVIAHHRRTGPIPDPETLAKYGKVRPDLVDRIVTMAENQASHRQMVELTMVKSAVGNSRMGIICALTIGMGGLAAAVAMAAMGHPWAGASLGGLDVIGLVSVFLYSTMHGAVPSPPEPPRQDLKNSRDEARSLIPPEA